MAATPGHSIWTTLSLSKALALARRGRMKDAEAVIAPAGTVPEDPVSLHALAALATSQGDYGRARRLWQTLLQKQPGHVEARRMIDAIDLWQSRPTWVPFVLPGLAVVGALILGAIILSALSGPDLPQPRVRSTGEQGTPWSSASPVASDRQPGVLNADGDPPQISLPLSTRSRRE